MNLILFSAFIISCTFWLTFSPSSEHIYLSILSLLTQGPHHSFVTRLFLCKEQCMVFRFDINSCPGDSHVD